MKLLDTSILSFYHNVFVSSPYQGSFNSFPINKFLDWSKLEAFADDKVNATTDVLFGVGRKHCGKRRKCWLPAFSPFLTMFLKGFFFRVFKSRDYVVKS